MKTITRRAGCPALFLAGATLALAALPLTASAQAVDSYLRSGARPAAPARQAAPAPQSAPVRSSPFFGRPEAAPSGLPFRRIQGNEGPASYPTIIVTGQQSGFSSTPMSRPTRPYDGGGNVFSNQYYNGDQNYDGGQNYNNGQNNYYPNGGLPPVGPANGFFNNLTPPVGPANGFSSTPTTRPTSPRGPQDFVGPSYGNGSGYGNTYYSTNVNTDQILAGGVPPLLGGYYYGDYCDSAFLTGSYPTVPSVYSVYSGFPQFILSPGVIVNGQPYAPEYDTAPQTFTSPSYSVTYNNNNYYVASPDRAQQLEAGGDQARAALKNAYPADSFQAAFGDVARAWTDGDVKPLRRHVRDSDTRISVSLNGKYSYSIASGDFVQITRDALTRLHTVSFEFTHVRKAKNGDVIAYGKHVYRPSDTAGAQGTADGDTVPFDQAGDDVQSATSAAPSGDEKTVYVSYTLRRQDGRWNVIAIDSSDHNLVPPDAK